MTTEGAIPTTLRCLSCGYDVASLIAQRGREEPGVCPECGASILENMRHAAGTPVQRGGRFRDYLRFVMLATFEPRVLVRSMRLGREITGGLCIAHCVASGVMAAFALIAVGFIGWAATEDAAWFGWCVVAGVVAGVATCFASLLLLLPITLVSAAIGLAMGVREVGWRIWGAADVGVVWFIWWPLIVLAAYFPSFFVYDVGGDAALSVFALTVVLGPPFLAVACTVRALHGLKNHPIKQGVEGEAARVPASKPPSPSNLRSP